MSDAIDDFDDLVFDEAALGQIDEIETAATTDVWPVEPQVHATSLGRQGNKVEEQMGRGGARGVPVQLGSRNPFVQPTEKTNTTFQIRKPGVTTNINNSINNHNVNNPAYRSPLPNVKRNRPGRPLASLTSPSIPRRPGPGNRPPAPSPGPTFILGKSQSSVIDLDGPIDLCSDDLYGDDGLDSLPMESLNAIDEMVHKSTTGGSIATTVQSELGFRSVHRSPRPAVQVGGSTGSRNSLHTAVGPVSMAPISSTTAYQTHLSFQPLGRKKKGKTWDRTQFSSTGGKNKDRAAGGKKKKKRSVVSFVAGAAAEGDDDDESEEEEEEIEGFDQFPLPFIDPSEYRYGVRVGERSELIFPLTARSYLIDKPPPERKHFALPVNASTYLYPTNVPKRDYQFEIIASCFLDNTLVALPTGLGKTFIAGTVMLNFYRWFPRGKIVFLMPTKPLVTQQHEACQTTCGIPSADAATITGDDPDGWRDTAWSTKRVFYATPQTFLIDMAKKRIDASDIVLVIVDEAHKASGNHSYVQCISYLQAVHPYFRIVALTATPGRTTEKVQEVVDKLHISRIEIREAESPDIAKYMFKKNINHHPIQLNADFESLIASVTELMEPLAKAISSTGLMRTPDSRYQLRYLKPFTVLQAMSGLFHNANNKKFIGSAKTLHKLSQALTYLMEYSLGMFFTVLKDINGSEQSGGKGKTSKKPNRLQSSKVWRELYQNTQDLIDSGEMHPKFARVSDLLNAHLEAKRMGSQGGENSVTRCMIFCSFREGVNELVEMLNKHPLIRAHKFVGRSQGKDVKDKGLTQAEQKSVIEKFKKNEYNCLVATSIGEEGLDIGEVDFIVIYNCPKTSIKALQRIGRAGRKRDGHIHVLATVGREDRNWDAAIFNHRDIQSEIIIGNNLELYDDAPPLLDKMPEPVLKEMKVDPWEDEVKNRGNKRKTKSTIPKASPRQRGVPIPEGITGFMKASSLTTNGKRVTARGRKKRQVTSEEEKDMDEDLPDLRDVIAKKADLFDSDASTPPPKKRKATKKTPTALAPRQSATKRSTTSNYKNFASSDSEEDASNEPEKDAFFESVFGGPSLPSANSPPSLESHDPSSTNCNDMNTTPLRPTNGTTAHTQALPTPATGQSKHSEFSQLDDRWMLDLDDDEFQPQIPGAQILAKPFKPPTFKATPAHGAMGPPTSIQKSSARVSATAEAPTSDASPVIVRRRGANRILIVPSSEPDTPVGTEPQGFSPASLIPRTGQRASSPIPAPARRRDRARARNMFVEDDVDVSGDDRDDDEEDISDEESESDRRFAGHFEPTQAPKGYNQRRAYLAGLSTQAPQGGPAFADRSNRHNDFISKARRPILLSQEDTQQGPSSDYEGSFVCDDEEPVAYNSDSDDMAV